MFISTASLLSLLGKLLEWAERREQWGVGKLLLGHFLSCQKLQRDSESHSLQGKQILGACVPAPGIGFMMPTFSSHLVPVTGPERLLTCCPEGRPRSLDGDLGRAYNTLTSGAPSWPEARLLGPAFSPIQAGPAHRHLQGKNPGPAPGSELESQSLWIKDQSQVT